MMKAVFFAVALSAVINVFAQKTERQQFLAATVDHHMIAILPASVTLNLRKGEKARTTEERVKNTEQEMAFMIQSYFYQWLEKKGGDYHFTVAIQNAKVSDNMIFSNGLSFDQYKILPPDSIARLLNADAVLLPEATISKTMDDDLAEFFRVINLGIFPGNAMIGMKLKIIDGKSGILLWQREYAPEDNSAATIERNLEKIVKKAAKIFPYSK